MCFLIDQQNINLNLQRDFSQPTDDFYQFIQYCLEVRWDRVPSLPPAVLAPSVKTQTHMLFDLPIPLQDIYCGHLHRHIYEDIITEPTVGPKAVGQTEE